MQEEFNALIKNGTWELVPRPTDTNTIRCIWLYKHMYMSSGSLQRYKARLLVNRESQQVVVDCDETFSIVVKPVTIQTIHSLALYRD